jgi:hypothetical protein
MSTTTATKERRKGFRCLSVRAILEGHKTQFREVVKLPDLQSWQLTSGAKDWHFIECSHSVENCNDFIAGFSDKRGTIEIVKCPYGKPADPDFDRPADRLWVRETHRYWFPDWTDPPAHPCRCRYKADNSLVELAVEWEEGLQFSTPEDVGLDVEPIKWRPSIFMPRWASRITLEITAVRVERLQSISEADARAEGVRLSQRAVSPSKAQNFWWDYLRSEPSCPWARESFGTLWESINGPDGPGSWDANPWVWVVEFRRVQP